MILAVTIWTLGVVGLILCLIVIVSLWWSKDEIGPVVGHKSRSIQDGVATGASDKQRIGGVSTATPAEQSAGANFSSDAEAKRDRAYRQILAKLNKELKP